MNEDEDEVYFGEKEEEIEGPEEKEPKEENKEEGEEFLPSEDGGLGSEDSF